MNFFHSFHNRGMFERSLNTTFISPIPKIVGAVELKDFRPIRYQECVQNSCGADVNQILGVQKSWLPPQWKI